MLKEFKRNLNVNELEGFMNQFNQSLDELASGKAEHKQVHQLIQSLLHTQNEEGYWPLIPSPNVDGDIRVAYWFMPTYIASAFLMHYYLQADAKNKSLIEDALIKGLQASTKGSLNGHGHDALRGRIQAVEIFKKGNVIKFLEQYPNLAPGFTTLISKIAEGFNNALMSGETRGDWGEEYQEDIKKALAGFHLQEGTLIFVYGTLLKGRSNHNRFLSTAKFLGEGVINGFTLHHLGSYPGIKRSKKGLVKGEVYKVDAQTLSQIDMLEGEGSLYLRQTTDVICGTQQFYNVSTYIYNNRVPKDSTIPFEAQTWGKAPEKEYVWYAGFGSNLLYERFMTYIEGGTSRFNNRSYPGCTDKTPPKASLPITIPYKMYFGNNSGSWNNGGVSFLDLNTKAETLGRMYLITKEQLREVGIQESNRPNWYNQAVELGEHKGIKIVTLTNSGKRPQNAPADNYLNVLKMGLKETYPTMTDFEIMKYLVACGSQ
ncbi:gamma-glutamylcyclotransferase family protein [Dethiobacter alkaliphilus]|uniref:AIG2 family protein n=1 Tax=Dethiobacter alkaliphilus AHT 1 TaxID=555088 RepID=C0GD29_DETAL|nr:gamma-glutamylcyclotransferase family protein [Dethiobacter alkaliphilus]EEG79114.1 AIG2 family protein [Dethiobacter alkaliphilus AHT 1]